MNRHFVICREAEWEISATIAKIFLKGGIIWGDEDKNERDPGNFYYGITGESETVNELENIKIVRKGSINGR